MQPVRSPSDPLATRFARELKHDRGLLTCRFDSSGRFVFAGAQDTFVHRWEWETGEKVALDGHESWIHALAVSDGRSHTDEPLLVTGDYVGRVILWSGILGPNPQPRHVLAAHEGSVRAVAISPDRRFVASCGNDHMVRLWSAEDGREVQTFVGHDSHVYNVRFHPAGESLVSGDLKGIVREWRLTDGKAVRDMDAGALWTYSQKYHVDVGGVRGMAFSPDGSLLACSGATGDKGIAHSGNPRVVLIDWASGRTLGEFAPPEEVIATAWGVLFHPDGYLVSSGGSRTGGYLWFWRPDETTAFHTFDFKKAVKSRGPGFDLDLHPDGSTLAVAHFDGSLRLFTATPEA